MLHGQTGVSIATDAKVVKWPALMNFWAKWLI